MEIIHYPHPALSQPCEEVRAGQFSDLDERLRKMFELMYENKGVGLAAPQVAWNVRLFLVNPTGEEKDELVLINPRIIATEGQEDGEEGCLSFPGIYAKVRRSLDITVEFLNAQLEPQTLECSGLLARIIQHEFDHLENVLLVHRMSVTDKFMNRRKLKELKERFTERQAPSE